MKFWGTRQPNFPAIGCIDYNAYWRERGFALNSKLKEREEIILRTIPTSVSVFDIGCGNSLLPVRLKEKGCQVSVGDISDIVLAGFKHHGLEPVLIDLNEIGTFASAKKYDYLILSEVLEHLANPEEVLLELKKYTRYFVLTIPNSAFYRYRWHLFFKGRFFTQWFYHPSEHLRYWSHLDFLDWLRALGLRVERVAASNGFDFLGFKFYHFWPNLFGHQICYFVRVP